MSTLPEPVPEPMIVGDPPPEATVEEDDQPPPPTHADDNEGGTAGEWPPSNWVDKFQTPQRSNKRFINTLPLSVTRLKSKKVDADGKKAKDRIGVFFSATPVEGQEGKAGAWVEYTPPELMGVADCLLVHVTTWKLFESYSTFHGTSGIKLHCVPHPEPTKMGVFVVKEIFLFKGISVNGEMQSKQKCLVCEEPAAVVCMCESVFYCTHQHMQQAFSSGEHSAAYCDQKAQQLVLKDATRARQRIIAKHDLYEDEKEHLLIEVQKREMKEALEKEKNERDDEQDIARQTARSTQKRDKLRLESAKARAELGMEADPNIDPAITEKAALEVFREKK